MEAKKSNAQDESRAKLSYYKALNDIGNQIHSATDMDEILINLKDQILSLFDADRITIYVVDSKTKEIYQRFRAGAMPTELRLPINHKSISGYTASTAQITNITNVYDRHELSMINKDLFFDKSWDERSNYLSKSMLTVPILFTKFLIGVLQLINKKSGDKFTLEDQNSAVEMAKVLGIAIYNQIKLSQQTKKRTKFDFLINHSIVTQKELEKAIAIARDRKIPVESVFIDEMKVKKVDVGRSLGELTA
jgi:transcriptional regulator with GAF, ATPase, and Fis domain